MMSLNRRDLLVVLGLFVASTAFYALLGVRFHYADMTTGMQYIDPRLLIDRLFESIWYYHASPPLLNLFIGTGLKVFGEHADWFYTVSFHMLGLVASLSVYALTLKLSGSRIAATIVTGLLVFSPSFVVYENWLFYSFPAMTLLTFAAWVLHRYLETRATKWCVAFFATLAVLLLTRSLFHLGWMVLTAVLLIAVLWDSRKQILIAAAVPVLVVALWYGKNYYYFGTFAASSWLGLGLSNISTLMVPPEQIVPLVQQGKVSPWALVSRYDSRGLIFLAHLRPPVGAPVADDMQKSDGRANWNYRDIPAIDRYYKADAIAIARAFPASYVHGFLLANRLYFSPTGMNLYASEHNRAAVQPMEPIFNALLSGVFTKPSALPLPRRPSTHLGEAVEVNTSVPLIVAWIVVLGFGYAQARKTLMSRAVADYPRAVVMGFIVFTAVYLYIVSTALELGENYRYRLVIEPLFFVLTATAITAAVRAIRRRRSGHEASAVAPVPPAGGA